MVFIVEEELLGAPEETPAGTWNRNTFTKDRNTVTKDISLADKFKDTTYLCNTLGKKRIILQHCRRIVIQYTCIPMDELVFWSEKLSPQEAYRGFCFRNRS